MTDYLMFGVCLIIALVLAGYAWDEIRTSGPKEQDDFWEPGE